MIRLLSFFSFIGSTIAQLTAFRDPLLTVARPTVSRLPSLGTIAPTRTIRPIITTLQNITSTVSTITLETTTQTTLQTTTQTTTTQTNEPVNDELIDNNLFFIIIPSGLLLLFFIYMCLKKRRKHVNVVNIDLNIENKIPIQQETKRQTSNLSEHFYEEINYEARYEMPNVKYENVIENNEYGTQVTTSV